MSVRENIKKIKQNIPSGVTLIAVSKTKEIPDMKEAYEEGIRDFGENKVQELDWKLDEFYKDVNWHLIGHLQRNKVKYIVGKVHLIHTLDSIRLLQEIERQYSLNGSTANVLIQINIGKEGTKTGVFIEELEDLIKACEECSSVKVQGLMAIIPQGDEESSTQYFVEMKKIWDELAGRAFNNIEMKYLSMGMSGDYNLAIAQGSNMIRVGEGIFGKRNYDNKTKGE